MEWKFGGPGNMKSKSTKGITGLIDSHSPVSFGDIF